MNPIHYFKIEAMPTTIGKKLRSRKVQLACERRQNQYAENGFSDKQSGFGVNDPNYTNLQTLEETKQGNYFLVPQSNSYNDTELKVITRGNNFQVINPFVFINY